MRVPQERSSSALGAIPVGYVEEKHPDVIVSFDAYAEAILRSPAIREEYGDRVFPPFLPADSSPALIKAFGDRNLHILVEKGGLCDAGRLYEKVAAAY